MEFRKWLGSFGLLAEAQKISDYLKQNDALDQRDGVSSIPAVKDFLKTVIERNPVPFKTGKQGFWIRGGNQYPVKIADTTETTVQLERIDGNDWSEIYHLWPVFADPQTKKRLVLPKTKANIVDAREYTKYLNWLTYLYLTNPEAEENPNFFFKQLFNKHSKTLDQSIDQKDTSFLTTDFNFESLEKYRGRAEEKESKRFRSNKPGGEGRTILEFPNGWKWLSLDKGYCREEGDAAGHCGNTGAAPGENILSLRDPENRIHMTVVVRNGVTNEMKAPGNRKPQPYTHPYVMGLLKTGLIEEIGPGKYLSQNDFKLSDLSINDLQDLSDANPKLIPKSPIVKSAVESQGNQDRFQKLVMQAYQLSEFPYRFDYDNGALLIGSGPLSSLAKEYNIQNTNYQSGIDPKDAASFNYSPQHSLEEGLQLFESLWDDIPNQVVSGLARYLSKDKINFYELRIATDKDQNLRNGIKKIWNAAAWDLFVNASGSVEEDESGSGLFIKIDPKRTSQVDAKLLMKPESADRYLKLYQDIEVPARIDAYFIKPDGVNKNNVEHWRLPFIHALQQNPFWERPALSKSGKTWQQEVDAIPGREEELTRMRQQPRQPDPEAAMQWIDRELPNREMQGTEREFIADLQKKGLWDQYQQWKRSRPQPPPFRLIHSD